jgi:hypothetical protein
VRALLAAEERGQGTLGTGGGRAEEARLRLGAPEMGGKASIYREKWDERQTVRLDPRTGRVPSSCLFGNHAHPTSGCSLEGHVGWATNRYR